MEICLNPGNARFSGNYDEHYVDKSDMIELINKTIETSRRLTWVSRPRCFGKSLAAQMLCAYYDKTCDSHELFSKLSISDSQTYEDHINRYDVIYLDMTGVSPYTAVGGLQRTVLRSKTDVMRT